MGASSRRRSRALCAQGALALDRGIGGPSWLLGLRSQPV